MSPYKLRRCDLCKQFHASFLVEQPNGQVLRICYDCWQAKYSGSSPEQSLQHTDPADPPNPEAESQ